MALCCDETTTRAPTSSRQLIADPTVLQPDGVVRPFGVPARSSSRFRWAARHGQSRQVRSDGGFSQDVQDQQATNATTSQQTLVSILNYLDVRDLSCCEA